eukprot:scaffold8288_cov57-Attheya_sp.AAC.1
MELGRQPTRERGSVMLTENWAGNDTVPNRLHEHRSGNKAEGNAWLWQPCKVYGNQGAVGWVWVGKCRQACAGKAWADMGRYGMCRHRQAWHVRQVCMAHGKVEYCMALWQTSSTGSESTDVFGEVLTSPVLEQGWRCDNGALVVIEGYPLTQYYAQDDDCMLVGLAPAFFLINQEMPTDSVPLNIVLQRWPTATGPDQRIVESNPLYQYAWSNVPIQDEELRAKLTIYTPSIGPGADYHLEPPNINGQFPALHHNFYVETYLMNHAYTAFLNCHNDKEQTALWMTMVPSLMNYESMFCSICSCQLPEFYFTKNQCHMKWTRQARHCETNRWVKIVQVNWILGGLSYFVGPRQCAVCMDYCSKHEFTNGCWKRMGRERMCRDCLRAMRKRVQYISG